MNKSITYKGFKLPEVEVNVLKELEKITDDFNFEVKDNHVVSVAFEFLFPKYSGQEYFFRILNVLSSIFEPSEIISYLSDNHREKLNSILKNVIHLPKRDRSFYITELIILTILDYVDDFKWDEKVESDEQLSALITTFKSIIMEPLISVHILSNEGINRSVVKVAEYLGEEAIKLLKTVLNREIENVDIYHDEFHNKFFNLVPIMKKYGDLKTFIKYLNGYKHFDEIFYPYWKEELYPLLAVKDFIIDGLNSTDKELSIEANKFISKILELLRYTTVSMRDYSYASSILYFLHVVFNKTDQNPLGLFIEKLPEIERDELKSLLKELLEKKIGAISLEHETETGEQIIALISSFQNEDKKNLKSKFSSGYLPDIEYLIKNGHLVDNQIKPLLENLEVISGIADFFGDSEELKIDPPRFIRDSLKIIIEKTDDKSLQELFENFLPCTPPERLLIPHSWESFVLENNFLNELSSDDLDELLENPELNLFQRMINLVLSYREHEHVDSYWIEEGILNIMLEKSPEAIEKIIQRIIQNKDLDELYQLFKSGLFDHHGELIPLDMEFVELAILSLQKRTVYYREYDALHCLVGDIGRRSPKILLELFKKAVKENNDLILTELMASDVFPYLNVDELISEFENNRLNIFDLISNRLKTINEQEEAEYEYSKLKDIHYYMGTLYERDESFKEFIDRNVLLTLESGNFRSIANALELGFLRSITEIKLSSQQADKIYRSLLKMFEFLDKDYFIYTGYSDFFPEDIVGEILRELMFKYDDYRITFTKAILDSILENTPESIYWYLITTSDYKADEYRSLTDFIENHDFEQILKEYDLKNLQFKLSQIIKFYSEKGECDVDVFIERIARILLKFSYISQELFISFLDGMIEVMSQKTREKFNEYLLIPLKYGFQWGELYGLKKFVLQIYKYVNKDSPKKVQYFDYGDDIFIVDDGVLEIDCNIIYGREQQIKLDMSKFKNFEFVENLRTIKIKGNVEEISGLLPHTNLEELVLESTEITEIEGLEKLKNLKILNLERNQITKIKGMKDLENLESLNLRDNKINEIEGLENLKKLKVLNLSGNNISEIKGLCYLTNLEELDLSGKKLNLITEMKGLEMLKNLKKLNLSHHQITQIKGMEGLVNLESLILMDNKIKEIEGLENLKNLEILNLSVNKIAEIKGLNTLVNLKRLNLTNNRITEIKGLDQLKSLEFLDFRINLIDEIKGLDNLINIKKIYLKDNDIPEIPPSLSSSLKKIISL